MNTPARSTEPIPASRDSPPSYNNAVKMGQPKKKAVSLSPPEIVITPPGLQPRQNQNQLWSPSEMKYHRLRMEYIRHLSNDPSLGGHSFWLYVVVLFDMITSGFLVAFMKYFKSGEPIQVEKGEGPGHGLLLSFRVLKLLMAILLFAALQTRKDSGKLACFQLWIYGAFLVLWKEVVVFLGVWSEFSIASQTIKGRRELMETAWNVLLRWFWIRQLRRHANFLRAKMAMIENGLDLEMRDTAVSVAKEEEDDNLDQGEGHRMPPMISNPAGNTASGQPDQTIRIDHQGSSSAGPGRAPCIIIKTGAEATASIRNNAVAVADATSSRSGTNGSESSNSSGGNDVTSSKQPYPCIIIEVEGASVTTTSAKNNAVSSTSKGTQAAKVAERK